LSEAYSTYYQSPIGLLKIASTDEHICEVMFNDKIQKASEHKKKHYPEILMQCIDQLMEYFDGNRTAFDLPLHQEGTDFQQEVWKLLTDIEYGKTISYHDLAKTYGNPNASRAIAAANGKNKISIIVPCHRVIGSNNELTGYSGGLWRKKWMLELEAKVAFGVQTLF
jgi:methylated-DNA-[protein]-cysteine S-methyltransferase